MKYTRYIFSYLFVLTVIPTTTLFLSCKEISNNIALGISLEVTGLPIIHCKTKISKKIFFEPRLGYCNSEDFQIWLFGTRVLYNVKNYKSSNFINNIYIGLEYDFLDIKNDEKNFANGNVFGIYTGLEKSLSRKFSLSLDIGPYFIGLSHKEYPLKEEQTNFVVNLFLNYYLK